jgi:hypothetical protein
LVNNDTLFFQGLRNYLFLFKDSTASGLDLINVMENTTGQNFNQFFQEWYLGEGYPTYSAKWNQIDNQLIVQLSQTTSAPAITPFFTTPVVLRFSRDLGGDTLIKINIVTATTTVQIPVNGHLNSLNAIDPSNFIVNKIGTIDKDATLAVSKNIPLDDDIHIYPNPTNGNLNINIPENHTCEVQIFNSSGKLVQTSTINESGQLALYNLPKGDYIVQLKDKNGEFIRRKIIRQ